MISPLARNIGVLFLLIAGLSLGGWYVFSRSNSTASGSEAKPDGKAQGKTPSIPVTAVAISRRDIPVYLEGLGTVQANYTVIVRAQVDGQLMKFALREGQQVHQGELIAQIDPQPFEAQLDQVKARKEQDQAKLVQDQAKVKQDSARKEQDQAKQSQDEAILSNAQVTLKRLSDTAVVDAVTVQSVDDQRSLVRQTEAAIRADQAAILADAATLQVDEAVIQADLATIKMDEAAIKYQMTQLAYTSIYATMDSVVGMRFVDPGNIVHANDPNGITMLTQMQPIAVVFTLPQQDLPAIRERMAQAKLLVLAVGSAGSQELDRGELEMIDNQIDTTTGTIRLKATFPNKSRKLWPGGFVNVRLLLDTYHDALVVAAPAVQHGPDGTFVFAIKADQTVEMRPVKVLLTQDNQAVLEGGLESGEQVVLTGQDRLKVGSKVEVMQRKAKPEGGKEGSTETQEKSDSRKTGRKTGPKSGPEGAEKTAP